MSFRSIFVSADLEKSPANIFFKESSRLWIRKLFIGGTNNMKWLKLLVSLSIILSICTLLTYLPSQIDKSLCSRCGSSIDSLSGEVCYGENAGGLTMY